METVNNVEPCSICKLMGQEVPAIERWWIEFLSPICETHAMTVRNLQAQVKAMPPLGKEKP
jgi:hypothetical protein